MPQLMPLSWVFSNWMMFVLLMSMSIVYSMGFKKITSLKFLNNNNKFVWCW